MLHSSSLTKVHPKKLNGYDFYRSLGSPKLVVAPMVNQSELAFRLLTRKYGAELCYSPMLHSRLYVEVPAYRERIFTTAPHDRPLIIQICGNDPDVCLLAGKMLESKCDAIDLNLGCPQGIARKGNYGAFLEPEVACAIVRKLHKHLSVPVTCKIRLLSDFDKTLSFCEALVEAGCQLLTIHGRTRENNKTKVTQCDWEVIKKIKSVLQIPVFANGGIESFEDIQRCFKSTGADGVMTSESILEYPALFANNKSIDGKHLNQVAIASEYIDIVEMYPTDSSDVRSHLFKLLFQELKVHTDLRTQLAQCRTFDALKNLVIVLSERCTNNPIEFNKKGRWYFRHRKLDKENAV